MGVEYDISVTEAKGKYIQGNKKISNDLWSRDLAAKEGRREKIGKNSDKNIKVDNGDNVSLRVHLKNEEVRVGGGVECTMEVIRNQS